MNPLVAKELYDTQFIDEDLISLRADGNWIPSDDINYDAQKYASNAVKKSRHDLHEKLKELKKNVDITQVGTNFSIHEIIIHELALVEYWDCINLEGGKLQNMWYTEYENRVVYLSTPAKIVSKKKIFAIE